MTIRQNLTDAMKTAMRSKDETALLTIRMMNSAIKQKDIDVARPRGDEQIGDEEILILLQSLIKSRREAIEMYKQGNRTDLADKEASEIEVIERFLPKQLDEQETRSVIENAIQKVGAVSIKDMGKVMAVLKSEYAGQLDMSKAGPTVKDILGGK